MGGSDFVERNAPENTPPICNPRPLNIELGKRPSSLERGLSIFILLILGGIATTIWGLQSRHHPANDSLLSHSTFTPEPLPGGVSQKAGFSAPENLTPSGPVEVFSPQHLSDKINGKAELYLSSGVIELTTQRFRVKNASGAWIEVFHYDMGKPANGFAVYSAQMRDDGVQISLTPFSYRTENSHFFLDGSTYVEIIGSGSTPEEMDARAALAEALVAASPDSSDALDELSLFPGPHLKKESISLISNDAFGFQGLDHVFTATYDLDGVEVGMFLSRRGSASEAAGLAVAYLAFLLENGGRPVSSNEFSLETARFVEILDTFELIVTIGPMLAGVRDAQDQATAERLGRLLVDHLVDTQRTGEVPQ